MTLWMVLLVVAVAWSSGTMFGWGLKELAEARAARRAGTRPRGLVEAPGAGQAQLREGTIAPGTQPQAVGETAKPRAALSTRPLEASKDTPPETAPKKNPAGSSSPGPEARPSLSDETAGRPKTMPPAAGEVVPASGDASPRLEPQTQPSQVPSSLPSRPVSGPTAAGASPAREPTEPAARTPAAALSARAPALLAPEEASDPAPVRAREPDVPRTVSSVRVEDEPLALPIGSRKASAPSPKSADYWRMLDRRNQRPGLTFWIEIVVLVMLLAGACWGVIYFATQPVRGLL